MFFFIPNLKFSKSVIFTEVKTKIVNSFITGCVMGKEKSPDVAALFHSMLVAYQMALRDILGTGRAVFVCPVLDNFMKINEAAGVHLAKGQSLDSALQNLSLET